MTTSPRLETLPTIPADQLATIAGGLDVGSLASSIGGLVDQAAGTGGQATKVANDIGSLVSKFL